MKMIQMTNEDDGDHENDKDPEALPDYLSFLQDNRLLSKMLLEEDHL